MTPLLSVRDLAVRFDGDVHALRGVDLTLHAGDTVAVIGESGAGKSTLVGALAGMVQPPLASGAVELAGVQLLGASDPTLKELRWTRVALALQGTPLNPVRRVGDLIAEPLIERASVGRRAARRRVATLADEVQLDLDLLDRYPHEVSGGQRRRVGLAIALALDPELLVLDEPTAGLDPVTSDALLDRIAELVATRGTTLVVVTHALAAAARLARRCLVLYGGEVMEQGDTTQVLGDPAHPYTRALVGAYPVMSTVRDLRPLRGIGVDPRHPPDGCPFHPRCPQAEPRCRQERVALTPSRGRQVACHPGGVTTLLRVEDVSASYGRGSRLTPALEAVSLRVLEGEAVGVVGASGSGKSTLAKVVSGHLVPDGGAVELRGSPLTTGRGRDARRRRARAVQLVVQDPWSALSPRLTVEQLVREPVELLGGPLGITVDRAVIDALHHVGLPGDAGTLGARIHHLSGGQLQRVILARALIVPPRLLVADEPTSLLDPSEQARVLVALRERQVELGLGLLLISHDLAVVRKVTDHVVVLDRGRVVEAAPTEQLCRAPTSDAARRLLAAAPVLPPVPRPWR